MKDKREIIPDYNSQDKEICGEGGKKDKQPARAADRENLRKRRYKETPTLPAEERTEAQKAIESLKKHSYNGTCKASFPIQGTIQR